MHADGLPHQVRRRPSIRIILMSATVNASLFSNYFAVRILVDETEQGLPNRDEVGTVACAPPADDETEQGLPIRDEVGTVACAPPASTIRTSPAPSLHIPGFTHPVEEHWLEEILMMTGFIIEPGSQYAKRERSAEVRR